LTAEDIVDRAAGLALLRGDLVGVQACERTDREVVIGEQLGVALDLLQGDELALADVAPAGLLPRKRGAPGLLLGSDATQPT